MADQFFQSPSSNSEVTEEKLQAWAERGLGTRALQELPLILVPSYFLCLSEAALQLPPRVRMAIQDWLKEARLEDERLRIERRFIPYTPILIPNTVRGQKFFKLAKAIADIPLNVNFTPKTQNQGYWFKTLHYHWQAQGIVIAQRLLGIIPDPLGENGVLKDRLADENLESLRLSSETEIACFQLLVRGEPCIKRWAKRNKIPYPFESPQDLLLELLKEKFLLTWKLGPGGQEKKPLSKAQQRDNVATRIRLLRQSPWLEETGERQDYEEEEQQYLAYLQEAGWSGYWLLALRPYSNEAWLEPYWDSYVQAFSKGKELTVDTFDWLNGESFGRPMSNRHQGVEATLDLLGYIRWTWA